MRSVWVFGAIVMALLVGCGDFIRKNDDRYMQPGALDPVLTGYYDVYNVLLLDKYRLRHEWPLPARACQYLSSATLGKDKDRYTGEVFIANDIYEENGDTKQRDANTPSGADFNRFVRSIKVQRPIYRQRSDGAWTNEITGYYENEEGLKSICFEAWVGTDHSLTVRLVKLPMDNRKSHYAVGSKSHTTETVGANTWSVWRYGFDAATPKQYGGEVWVLQLGETDYSLAFEFGFGAESFKAPTVHATFEVMFKHLIESVKIEPLTPAIDTEMKQLKAKAFEIHRQECTRMKKPPRHCKKYLDSP